MLRYRGGVLLLLMGLLCLSDCAAVMPMLLLGFAGNLKDLMPSSCCSEAAAPLDGSEPCPLLWGAAGNPGGPILLSNPGGLMPFLPLVLLLL